MWTCTIKSSNWTEKVYDETYTHRTSGSSISKNGNDYLYNYINENYEINNQKKIPWIRVQWWISFKKFSKDTNSAFGLINLVK